MKFELQRLLKRDSFGRVELVRLSVPDEGGAADTLAIRRVACGGSLPGSALVARLLLDREARALERLGAAPAQDSVPRILERRPDSLLREYVDGVPLSEAEALPVDFFERLAELVAEVHARGVCHNDLHKEQNVLVGIDGRPWLVDFQLASVHQGDSRARRTRCREDLRHVEKHRRRYMRTGRGPAGLELDLSRVEPLERSLAARWWRRSVKPVYVFVTRRILSTRDGEARRRSDGPFPRWTPALGPRRR